MQTSDSGSSSASGTNANPNSNLSSPLSSSLNSQLNPNFNSGSNLSSHLALAPDLNPDPDLNSSLNELSLDELKINLANAKRRLTEFTQARDNLLEDKYQTGRKVTELDSSLQQKFGELRRVQQQKRILENIHDDVIKLRKQIDYANEQQEIDGDNLTVHERSLSLAQENYEQSVRNRSVEESNVILGKKNVEVVTQNYDNHVRAYNRALSHIEMGDNIFRKVSDFRY